MPESKYSTEGGGRAMDGLGHGNHVKGLSEIRYCLLNAFRRQNKRARPCKHGVDGFFDNLKGDKLCVYTHLPNSKEDSHFCHTK